jgi:hypothetical protein
MPVVTPVVEVNVRVAPDGVSVLVLSVTDGTLVVVLGFPAVLLIL